MHVNVSVYCLWFFDSILFLFKITKFSNARSMAEMMFEHSPTQSVVQTSAPTSFDLSSRRLPSDSSQQPIELSGSRSETAPRLRSKSVRSCVTPPRFLSASANTSSSPSNPAHTVLLHVAPGTSVRVPYRVPIPPFMAAQLIHGMPRDTILRCEPVASRPTPTPYKCLWVH